LARLTREHDRIVHRLVAEPTAADEVDPSEQVPVLLRGRRRPCGERGRDRDGCNDRQQRGPENGDSCPPAHLELLSSVWVGGGSDAKDKARQTRCKEDVSAA